MPKQAKIPFLVCSMPNVRMIFDE